MSDLFLELSANPNARKLIKQLGLPLPLPQVLERTSSPWEARPLAGREIVVGGRPEPDPALVAGVAAAGATIGGRQRADALVFDARTLQSPADLEAMFAFFQPQMRGLARNGRVLVVTRPHAQASSPTVAATRRAVEGFVRSVGKEVGRKGATANLIVVADGADERCLPVVRWLLSPRAAFISGQPIDVDARAAVDAGMRWSKPEEQPLAGRVVLLTGAARGIGAATARLLAGEGAHVVCLDRPEDEAPVSAVARQIGGSVLLQDISAPDAPEHIARTLRDEHGGVDVVVHNAGVTRDKTLAKMDPRRWSQAIDINLDAVLRITSALLGEGDGDGDGERVLRDGGRVICLSSVAGIAGNLGQTNYAASKAGIIGFVESLAPALASHGVTVNAIAPGFIETRMTAAIPAAIRTVGRRLSNLSQGGEPADIGQLVTFLASPGSAGVTGRVVRACGGAFIGA